MRRKMERVERGARREREREREREGREGNGLSSPGKNRFI